MREAAAQMPDHGLGERDQPGGDARGRHQLADEEEKGDGEQGEFVDAVEELAHEGADGEGGEGGGDDDHGGDQGEGDGQPGIAEEEEQPAHDDDGGFVVGHARARGLIRAPIGAVGPGRHGASRLAMTFARFIPRRLP